MNKLTLATKTTWSFTSWHSLHSLAQSILWLNNLLSSYNIIYFIILKQVFLFARSWTAVAWVIGKQQSRTTQKFNDAYKWKRTHWVEVKSAGESEIKEEKTKRTKFPKKKKQTHRPYFAILCALTIMKWKRNTPTTDSQHTEKRKRKSDENGKETLSAKKWEKS